MTSVSDQWTRVCNKCKIEKPYDAFARMATGRGGWRYACRACQALRARGYLLNRRFGIDEAEYDRMFLEQGGQCAICRSTEPRGRWDMFHVDPCHTTGRVGGLLCSGCNTALGLLGDAEGLRRALAYVTNAAAVASTQAGGSASREEPTTSALS